jgi:hypothetical protein
LKEEKKKNVDDEAYYMCKFDFILIPNWKWWIAFFLFLTNKRIFFFRKQNVHLQQVHKKKGDGLFFKNNKKLGDYVPRKKKSKIKVGSTETCVIFPVVFSPDIILLTTLPHHTDTQRHTHQTSRELYNR